MSAISTTKALANFFNQGDAKVGLSKFAEQLKETREDGSAGLPPLEKLYLGRGAAAAMGDTVKLSPAEQSLIDATDEATLKANGLTREGLLPGAVGNKEPISV